MYSLLLVTRTRIDRLLTHTYGSATQSLRLSVPASPLFAEIDSPNQFLNAKTLASSILCDIKNKEHT